MLDLYKNSREDMNISNVANMIEDMETIFHYYDYEIYTAKRRTK